MKKTINLVSLIIVIVFIILSFPLIVNASSDTQLPVTWSIINGTGYQSESGPCFCYALAYARDVLDKKEHSWTEYSLEYLPSKGRYSYTAVPSKAKYAKNSSSSIQSIYRKVYDEIDAGRPSIMYVEGGRSTSQHYVAVIGYTNVSNPSSLSMNNFLIIDSALKKDKSSAENAGSIGYSLKKANGKYLCYTTDSGSIDPDPPYENIGDDFYSCIYNPESECQLTNSINNVNLKSATNDANQLWHFERDSDNGYKITSFIDGTCLDAENGNYSNETNIQTYNSNSTDSQRWYFIDIGMDHYSIRTKLGKAYVDAHTTDGVIEPGANVQLYSLQDSDAQVYCVNKVDSVNSFLAHNVGTDFYANIFNTSTDYLLTNTDNNVTLDSEKSSGTDASQIWKFERQSDGCYVIRSASNNRCLDAEMGKAEDGTNIQIYEDNGTEAQKWILCDTGNHSYIIKSAVGNAVIDAKTSAGEIYDGTSIQLYHPNGTAAQAYDIRVIDNISEIFAEDIGTDFKGYIINPSTGYRLTNNNSNITLDSETDNKNQLWKFERQEDNSYVIRSVVDDTCIDAAMGETDDDTNVQTYEYNGTEAQRWYFYKKGDNQYTIVSSKADKVIDARTHNGVIDDGTNIQLYHPNGSDAQIYSIQIKEEPRILGDADCDGEVTILDVTVIQRCLVDFPIQRFDEETADCDGDEIVSIIDATWIQRHLASVTVPYSISEAIAN